MPEEYIPSTIRSLQISEGDPLALQQYASQTGVNLGQNIAGFDTNQFNLALMALLKKYQQLGTKPYQQRLIGLEEEAAKRMGAEATSGMPPRYQRAIRGAQVGALEPSFTGTEQRMKTFTEQIQGLGDVLDTLRGISKDIISQQEKARDDARAAIRDALTMIGSGAFSGLDQTQVDELEKLAGYPKGYLSGIQATLKEREMQQKLISAQEKKILAGEKTLQQAITEEIEKVYRGDYGTKGARETALSILQGKFPDQRDELARRIYEIFPDGYEARIAPVKSTSILSPEVTKLIEESLQSKFKQP